MDGPLHVSGLFIQFFLDKLQFIILFIETGQKHTNIGPMSLLHYIKNINET